MRRRTFLGSVAGAAAGVFAAPARVAAAPGPTQKITDVELWRVEGRRQAVTGVNRQHQVNPLHVYDEHRPAPYHEPAEGKPATVSISAIYIKVKTEGGLEGLYGPIDREAAAVVDQQLKSFVRGKEALAATRSTSVERAPADKPAAPDAAAFELEGPVMGALGG